MATLKDEIKAAFQLHGFALKLDGSRYLEAVIGEVERSEQKTWIPKILSALRKLPLEEALVGEAELEEAIAECSQQNSDREDRVNIIDAFTVPNLHYDSERGKFLEREGETQLLHGSALSKFLVHRNRFALVHQRTVRHEIFASSSLHHGDSQFKLKRVEDLAASPKEMSVVILGILSQLKEDKYYLEDDTGHVELDFSQAKFHTGLVCESSVVLVEGVGGGGVGDDSTTLRVAALGFPPIELAATTRRHFGDLNFFGGPLSKCAASSEKLRILEGSEPDAFFVFLSDLWLDDARVMGQFARLLQGYAEDAPVAFVLCGQFLSPAPSASRTTHALRGQVPL